MSTGVLGAIVAAAARSSAERARATGRATIERAAASARPRPAALADALTGAPPRVIAECKRRSPSRGILCRDYRPAAIAKAYAAAGAAAISVLTEPAFFDGRLEDLSSVRAAVEAPLLRKDFVVSEFQILEARAAGADAVLLIVAALDDRPLRMLLDTAAEYELGALVEAHDADEIRRALDAGATMVGVNSRDLRSLRVLPATFEELAPLLPDAVTTVAESGIRSGRDVPRLRAMGYDGCLVGERFMETPDPGAALAAFLAEAAEEATR